MLKREESRAMSERFPCARLGPMPRRRRALFACVVTTIALTVAVGCSNVPSNQEKYAHLTQAPWALLSIRDGEIRVARQSPIPWYSEFGAHSVFYGELTTPRFRGSAGEADSWSEIVDSYRDQRLKLVPNHSRYYDCALYRWNDDTAIIPVIEIAVDGHTQLDLMTMRLRKRMLVPGLAAGRRGTLALCELSEWRQHGVGLYNQTRPSREAASDWCGMGLAILEIEDGVCLVASAFIYDASGNLIKHLDIGPVPDSSDAAVISIRPNDIYKYFPTSRPVGPGSGFGLASFPLMRWETVLEQVETAARELSALD